MRVLFSAESFGYGPIITGLSIVEHMIKDKNIKVDFIGSGVALEQAKLTNYFENFIDCNTYDFKSLEEKKKEILKYKVFLSSENMNGAIFAVRNSVEKIYYIDNLMWMWDRIPNELNDVTKYIISEIIPSKENYDRIGLGIKNPVFTGPLRNFKTLEFEEKVKKLIINIGGAESFLLNKKIIIEFYNKILNVIMEQIESEKFDKIIICGGKGVISNLKIKNTYENLYIKTLSNVEYINELNTSTHCILAAGLGNFVETISMDKNIMYLPPINYSQLLQLDYYKKQNFGFEFINWDAFPFYQKINQYLDEEIGVNLVVNNIEKYIMNDFDNVVSDITNEFINKNQKKYFLNRNKYVENMPKNCAKDIANIIIKDMKEGLEFK